jgi:hypothetical protein
MRKFISLSYFIPALKSEAFSCKRENHHNNMAANIHDHKYNSGIIPFE